MATLIRNKSGIYYLVYSQNGKRVWRSLRTRERRTAYNLYLKEEQCPLNKGSKSLREAQADFLPYVVTNLAPGAVAVYRNVFSQLNKFLPDKHLAEITPRDIDMYKISRIKDVSPSTVNHDLRQIRAFFNRLKLWGYLEKNPCDGIKEIRGIEQIPLYLTKENLKKLLEHTKGTQLHDIILLAAMTGLRKGELLNMTWQDVDLGRGTLLIRSSVSYRTKAGKIRTIPINACARRLLEDMEKTSDLLFPGDRGGPYNHDFLTRRFKKAIRRCGLDPRLHFHSLRHTFASLLVQDGVPLYNVQRLLGHSSSRVTEIYAHLGHAELGSSVERLNITEQL
jgi:integrase